MFLPFMFALLAILLPIGFTTINSLHTNQIIGQNCFGITCWSGTLNITSIPTYTQTQSSQNSTSITIDSGFNTIFAVFLPIMLIMIFIFGFVIFSIFTGYEHKKEEDKEPSIQEKADENITIVSHNYKTDLTTMVKPNTDNRYSPPLTNRYNPIQKRSLLDKLLGRNKEQFGYGHDTHSY